MNKTTPIILKAFGFAVLGLIVVFILFVIVKSIAKECTVDEGSFMGSRIVQTCDCFGFEVFDHWEAGSDSKCLGYVVEVNRY